MYAKCMAHLLTVTTKGVNGTWAVYLVDDSPLDPGQLVHETGPLLRSVSTWEELKALAAEHGIQTHQIVGAGLDQMEEELGPMPE
jgi:hypothetical protein